MSHFHHFYTQDQFLDAVKTNDFEKVEKLLAQHTDVIVCRQAAEDAIERGHVDCLKLLLPHCGTYTFDQQITSAVVRMQPEVVQTLVAHYPPNMVDTIRIQSAFEKYICEDCLNALLPYMSLPERFSLMLNVTAPMSENFVRACIDGIDPMRGNSVMLAWGAVYNDARFDVLYPVSDPAQAITILNKVKAVNGSKATKYNIAEAVERIEARMQREVLEKKVGAHACDKSRMKI